MPAGCWVRRNLLLQQSPQRWWSCLQVITGMESPLEAQNLPLRVRSASITASRGGGSMALARNCPIPPSPSSLMLRAISWRGVRNISGVKWVWSLEWEQRIISLSFDHREGSFFHQHKPLPSKVNSASQPTHRLSLLLELLHFSILLWGRFTLGMQRE